MTHQERYIETLTFGKPDRYILWQLFGALPGVVERWVSEGMPQPEPGADPLAFFELDPLPQGVAVNTSAFPGFAPTVLEDNEEYQISKDSLGRTNKLIKAAASIALPLDFPVSKPEDWDAFKEQFRYDPRRFAPDWLERHAAARREGLVVLFSIAGFYDLPRRLMGDERLAYAYYDYPDMIEDIQKTYTDLVCAILEEILQKADIDAVYFGEDMAYRGGLMISPMVFERFMAPYYKRVTDLAKSKGVKIFAVDCDGYVGELIPLLKPVGINTMYPFEVQAQSDIAQIRRDHGNTLAMIGGLDKFCVTKGKAAIDAELSAKLPAMVESGGYIASLDHRVTVETPFEDYLYYVNEAKKYLWGGKR